MIVTNPGCMGRPVRRSVLLELDLWMPPCSSAWQHSDHAVGAKLFRWSDKAATFCQSLRYLSGIAQPSFQQRQFAPRVGPFAADEDPHSSRPAPQFQQPGHLGNIGAFVNGNRKLISCRQGGFYLRVSLDKSGDGLGIERQREDCRRLAEQRGWTVTSEIVENNTSATYGPRPGFEQLLQLMESQQIDTVIVWHVDRLLRKMTDLERVIELVETSNVRVATVSGEIDLGTDMGRMVGRIMASVARAEVERKSARHKRANLQKAQAGKPHGSKRAYGYEADLVTIK